VVFGLTKELSVDLAVAEALGNEFQYFLVSRRRGCRVASRFAVVWDECSSARAQGLRFMTTRSGLPVNAS